MQNISHPALARAWERLSVARAAVINPAPLTLEQREQVLAELTEAGANFALVQEHVTLGML